MQKLKVKEDDSLTPKIEEPEEIIKEVKVQDTGRQLILPLPATFVEILSIRKGDKFIIKASVKTKEYSLRLKKNG